MHQFNTLTTTAATFRTKSPAPWVESAFVQVPREFFAIMHELSKTALTVYLGHLANAMSKGENAGRSFQYRDSFAAKFHCSTSKLDRGNSELAERGMIRQSPTRRANNAQEWLLCPPSMWLFDSLKTAPRLTQKRVKEDAKPRPITKEAKRESFKTNSAAPVVADSKESVSDPETAALPVERKLIELGVNRTTAAALCDAHPLPMIEQQIEWLDARKPRSRARTIVSAIKGNWDAPGVKSHAAPETAQNGAAYAAYSDARATDAPKADDAGCARVVELCLESLDERQRAYIEVCQSVETLPLAQILERDCNYEFAVAAKRAAAERRAH